MKNLRDSLPSWIDSDRAAAVGSLKVCFNSLDKFLHYLHTKPQTSKSLNKRSKLFNTSFFQLSNFTTMKRLIIEASKAHVYHSRFPLTDVASRIHLCQTEGWNNCYCCLHRTLFQTCTRLSSLKRLTCGCHSSAVRSVNRTSRPL